MNKDLATQLIKLLREESSVIANGAIEGTVNRILWPTTLVTEYVEMKDEVTDRPSKLKESTAPMVCFLKKFKETVSTVDSSRIGFEFAVEYLESLHDFAVETNAEETVISEINELLALISE